MLLLFFLNCLAIQLCLAWSLALHTPRDFENRAAYFQDNDPTGNSIVALRISDNDGTLSSPVQSSTGGKGLAGLVAISQDSVTVSQGYLFITNAGDDTLSFFVIDGNDPMHPKLVGIPSPTLGNTPVSVAYSPSLKAACVLNSGANAGVSCFSADDQEGLTPLGGLRPIPQIINAPNVTTPAAGPLVIGADIAFNPSSTALFVTIGSANAKSGLIYAYPIQGQQISTNAVVSSFPSLTSVFSLNFLDYSDSHLLVTNPMPNVPGAAFLQVGEDLKITTAKTITLADEQAACWVAYAPQLDSAYVIDAAQPNFTVINPETGDVRGVVQYEAKMPGSGGFDARVQGDYLYFLTDDQSDPKINVFDISDGGWPMQVQSFDVFAEVGAIPDWMGMAVWPSIF